MWMMPIAMTAAFFFTDLAQEQEQPLQPLVATPLSPETPALPTLPPPAPPARAPQKMGGDFDGFGDGAARGPGYGAVWYPASAVAGQGQDLSLLRQSIKAGVPLWRNDGDLLALSTVVRHNWFFTDAILPDTRRPFPEELWSVQLGLNYIHRFDNGWTGGVMLNVRSASDKPFNSFEEIRVGTFAFLRVPVADERDWWLFSLMYAPFSDVSFPIPGIAYVWNPSDDLRLNLGLPFVVLWRPLDALTVNVFYVPVFNVRARVTYRLGEGLDLYAGYESLREAYLLADRADSRDRFFDFEQRVIGGLRWQLSERVIVDLNGGYAFDRYFGEGRKRDDLHDRLDVEPGAFLGASLNLRF